MAVNKLKKRHIILHFRSLIRTFATDFKLTPRRTLVQGGSELIRSRW